MVLGMKSDPENTVPTPPWVSRGLSGGQTTRVDHPTCLSAPCSVMHKQ